MESNYSGNPLCPSKQIFLENLVCDNNKVRSTKQNFHKNFIKSYRRLRDKTNKLLSDMVSRTVILIFNLSISYYYTVVKFGNPSFLINVNICYDI